MRNKKMMTISIFISLGIILSYVEHLLPTQFIMAGAKLGLANIVTVTTLVFLDKKSALIILLLRVCLVSFLFSGFSGFLYSLVGGLFSYCVMMLMLKLDFKEVTLVGVSVVGSVFHGLGQVIVASILFSNYKILLYFPTLLLTALITGVFIGLVSNYLTERIKKEYII